MEVPYYTPDQVNLLPDQPGVYKFYNHERTLIYVGKAKNLKNRVSSYFNKSKGRQPENPQDGQRGAQHRVHHRQFGV